MSPSSLVWPPARRGARLGPWYCAQIMTRSDIVEWVTLQRMDPWHRKYFVHDLPSLIRTSVLLAAQDWRDHDDADALRDDRAFQLAVS